MKKDRRLLVMVAICIVQSLYVVILINENDALKAQLVSAQPTAVSSAIFIEPTDQPLDRVTWTDLDGEIHLLACGEPVADNQTGEMKLVSQYRAGKTITKIKLIIP